MVQHFLHWFASEPFLVLFITIAFGYFIGKFKYKTFVLGGIAGSLIMGVLIGQINVKLAPEIGTIFFALFIYAVGYQGGPQFFRSLNKQTLVQLISATITCVLGLATVLVAAYVFHLDRGTAAGLGAGGLTQSAMIGTANGAIAKLGLTAAQTQILQSHVAVGYAVCYIFGSFGPILLLSAVFPAMMGWNLRDEAKKLAKTMQGDRPLLDPGQYEAIPSFDTRIYHVPADSKLVGQTTSQLFEYTQLAVEALVRENDAVEITPTLKLSPNDVIALTGPVDAFIHQHTALPQEVACPAAMVLTEETRDVVVTNPSFENKTLKACYEATDPQTHYGIYVKSVSRLGEPLDPESNLEIKRGDEVTLMGRGVDLNRVASKLGKVISAQKITDYVTFGIGMALGVLIGMITIPIGGVSISVGTGGGCLFSGLIFGWLRSRHPRIGALPTGASNFLRDFGLAVFVTTVGLTAGPQAVTTIKHYGMELFLLGVGVTLIPQILTFYISYYLLKIKNPIVLLSTIAGGRSANPGFAALLEKAGNSTPVVPFTATYAIANIWLTLWGPIIIALVTKNIS